MGLTPCEACLVLGIAVRGVHGWGRALMGHLALVRKLLPPGPFPDYAAHRPTTMHTHTAQQPCTRALVGSVLHAACDGRL